MTGGQQHHRSMSMTDETQHSARAAASMGEIFQHKFGGWREAEAMRALWNAAAGATTAICHALDDGAVSDHNHAAVLEMALSELNGSLAKCRALPTPDKEGEV